MTKSIGTDGDVSREPPTHQHARGIEAQGTYRKDLVASCLSDVGHVDVPPAQAVQGA